MTDLLIGIIATLLSTVIIGLFGLMVIKPYNAHHEVCRKVLRVIRNYEDPRRFVGYLAPSSLMMDCIDKQLKSLQEIFDLISEQKDMNKLLYRLFRYDKISSACWLLFEYVRNPIMLKETKEFEDDYRLNTDTFFRSMKSDARFPWGRFLVIALLLVLLLTTVVILVFRLAVQSV